MLWVEKVLAPFVKHCSPGTVPYFLLDKYMCHYQGTIMHAIIIPGGCMGLVQPIDVGISRPWKNQISYLWKDRMVKTMEYNDANTDKFTTKWGCKLIAKWGCLSWNRIPSNVA